MTCKMFGTRAKLWPGQGAQYRNRRAAYLMGLQWMQDENKSTVPCSYHGISFVKKCRYWRPVILYTVILWLLIDNYTNV